MDYEQMILDEVRGLRTGQGEVRDEVGKLSVRLAVVEVSMEQVSAKLGETKQTANGTADYADDIDGRVEILEGWCQTFKGRASRMGWSLFAFALAQTGTLITYLIIGRRK